MVLGAFLYYCAVFCKKHYRVGIWFIQYAHHGQINAAVYLSAAFVIMLFLIIRYVQLSSAAIRFADCAAFSIASKISKPKNSPFR